MSVPELLTAVAAKPDTALAQVSSSLLYRLEEADEVRTEIREMHLPNDPQFRHAIDPLIRAMGSDPNDPTHYFVYVLSKHPSVIVQLGAYSGLSLAPSGSESFRLT